MDNNQLSISVNTFQRLPKYLNFLKTVTDKEYISATEIAKGLNLNDVKVRKDLSVVSGNGKPKVGYKISSLIDDINRFLGYDSLHDAVLLGAGHLGKALMMYGGFREYGLKIVAGFDKDPDVVGDYGGKKIYGVSMLAEYCREHGIKIGIITTPAANAQEAANSLIDAGIKAIWNFAPAHINAEDGILVQNENMACSLALLTRHLDQMLEEENK